MADQDKLLRHPLSLGLLALLCALAMTSASNRRDCGFVSVTTGLLPSVEPFGIVPDVRGYLHCAAACLSSLGLGCLSLSYSEEQRECRMYSVFDLNDVTVVSSGYQYFRGCPVDQTTLGAIGDPCGGDGDCGATHSECRGGTCQCMIGGHFQPGPGTCVDVCPEGYGPSFSVVRDRTLKWTDFDDYPGSFPMSQCEAWCNAKSYCAGFDHNQNGCHLYNSAPGYPWDYAEPYPGNNYYQRVCYSSDLEWS